MQEEYCDFDNNFLFQDSRMGTNEVPPCGKPWWYNTQHGKSKSGYPENATVTKDKKTKSSILKSRYSNRLW